MGVSFIVARTVPETVNRDLQLAADARSDDARPGLTEDEDVRNRNTLAGT